MAVEVIVPEGCAAGESFLVETDDGGTFSVLVPPDGYPGMPLLLELPDAQPLEVIVPSGVFPGDSFLVEHAGETFSVEVPDGCEPGSPMRVDVPRAPPCVAESGEARASADGKGRPASLTVDATEEKPKGKLALSLALFGGLSLNLSLDATARFHLGQQVEVYRTDGYWSLATVREFEPYGFTYTVELEDGRMKYLVEEEELRPPVIHHADL
ncbi:hypothetical protein AB1Y20_005669 [Prymnesium parvum]|uniref:Uncharacterized protein n=1 Tax=Prymnesium parvum TaxID=97485 RepID=A0AB34J3Z7_PRYPA